MSADYEKRAASLTIIGDEAFTDAELERRERAKAAARRYRATHGHERRAAYQRRYRAEHAAEIREKRRPTRILVGSLHDGGCTGPTRRTGCRCQKIRCYDQPR